MIKKHIGKLVVLSFITIGATACGNAENIEDVPVDGDINSEQPADSAPSENEMIPQEPADGNMDSEMNTEEPADGSVDTEMNTEEPADENMDTEMNTEDSSSSEFDSEAPTDSELDSNDSSTEEEIK
ncbi:hypothetical protein [Mesobacillus maritimus]|uniref:hypothetical protein n=1 Tax=Mesobacillus maritimus TaxID=1643336 RepID=UPI003850EE33